MDEMTIQHGEEQELVLVVFLVFGFLGFFIMDNYQSLRLKKVFGGCLLDLPLCSFLLT